MPHRTPSLDLILKLHDTVNELICVIDREGHFVYINQASYRILGYRPEELIGKSCYDMIVEEEREGSKEAVDSYEKGQIAKIYENRYYRKDGSIAVMLWEGELNRDDQMLYCTGRDVTEKRRMEQIEQAYRQELQHKNEHLERITDAFIGLNKDFIITYWNHAAETMFKISRHQVLGNHFIDSMEEASKEVFLQHLHDVTTKKQPKTYEMYSTYIGRWLETSLYTSVSGLSIYCRDITDKKKMEDRLKQEREQQQKRITAAVIKATENERAHVGKELHDNVNQVLTTVKLYTELCISEEQTNKELLHKSSQLLQSSINEIRGLSKRLSAPSLGNIRLKESVGELVEAINSTQKLAVIFKANIDELEVSEEVHVAVYRILQEHFTNVLKHANASKVQLAITVKGHVLKVKVTDNGKGFDPNQLRRGIGIENMTSRTEGINGMFLLASKPGKGCMLEVAIPLVTKKRLKAAQ
jgi:PAS domain S-box-containing protein